MMGDGSWSAHIHKNFKKKNRLIDGVLYRECSRCLKLKDISQFTKLIRRNIPKSLISGAPIVRHRNKYARYCKDCEPKHAK